MVNKVLIEPYWNVKKCGAVLSYDENEVLIEPYWNVKADNSYTASAETAVLIEPYWNVKNRSPGLRIFAKSINRTILECKEEIITFENVSFMVLIEPYWNVKAIFVHFLQHL